MKKRIFLLTFSNIFSRILIGTFYISQSEFWENSQKRERTARVMKEKYPVEMVERAVKGMLPKGRLGRQMYKKLFVYADENHPHIAQKPEKMEI